MIATRDEARPHAGADGRDAHPYLARMAFAGGLGLAVGGLTRRTSRDAGPYLVWLGQHAVLPLPEAGGLSWGDGLQGRRVEVAVGRPRIEGWGNPTDKTLAQF